MSIETTKEYTNPSSQGNHAWIIKQNCSPKMSWILNCATWYDGFISSNTSKSLTKNLIYSFQSAAALLKFSEMFPAWVESNPYHNDERFLHFFVSIICEIAKRTLQILYYTFPWSYCCAKNSCWVAYNQNYSSVIYRACYEWARDAYNHEIFAQVVRCKWINFVCSPTT